MGARAKMNCGQFTWPRVFSLLVIASSFFEVTLGNKPPYFTADLSNHVITENTPVGTVVYTLKAEDPENSPLKFGLMGTDKFTVDEKTGEVTVAKPIDREIATQFKLSVTVEDVVGDHNENNLVTVPVIVTVLDSNDSPPRFQNLSSFESIEVSEEARVGSKIIGVSVTDPDTTGMALSLTCSPGLQSPEACEVFPVDIKESSAGHLRADIKLGSKLDFNRRSVYQFTLASTDGEHTTKATVVIRVLDVQNTPPVFMGSMSGRVSEDAPVGSLVMVIEARDGDMGKPRAVKLSLLTNPGDSFQLDSKSGELMTTRPLDREILGSVLKMEVKAQEILHSDELGVTKQGDIDVIQTIGNITILLDDVNDFPPKFNHKELWTDLDENTKPGTPLSDLDLEIVDLDTGTFQDFTLRIDGPLADLFDIEPKFASGTARPVIRIKKQFDFENPNERKFLILVIAQNVEEPQLFSTATITVVVNDLNDNAPTFEQQVYTLTVPESTPPGTLIGSITAQDPDSKEFGTEGIVYQLVGSGNKKFNVNSQTGDIFVGDCSGNVTSSTSVTATNCLDYETQKTYDLLYMASDNYKQDGFIHSIVPLQILLTDSNDWRPTFKGKFGRTLRENAHQFEPKFFIRAEDVDTTAVLSYRIMDDPTPPNFKIDPNTGQILIKTQVLPPGNYSFKVEAHDGEYKAATVVTINVTDINNHGPTFDSVVTKRQVNIPENTTVGTVVSMVKAEDLDLDDNGLVNYAIDRGTYGHFDVDPWTGAISLAKPLDAHIRDKYELVVTAEDKGEPPLRTSTTILVLVDHVYLLLPKITPKVQRVQVSESAGIGDLVLRIKTEGSTEMDHEDLRFQFVQPVEARNTDNKAVRELAAFPDWFHLTPDGQVIVKEELERDLVTALNYTILLTSEKAVPGAKEFGTLILTLFEVNDLPPRVEDMEIETDEELPPGMSILTLEAEDPEGGHISNYYVQEGAEFISVDNKTGEIKVAGRLDFEDRPMYNCTVVVVDSGVPQLSSTATIAIHLLNINDNNPVFNQTDYYAELDEHSPEGTVVTTVHATDADGDAVSYEIQPGPFSKAFKVDRLGRVIISRDGPQLIDRELIKDPGIITVGIGAKDSGRIGFSLIHILVQDLNDVIPSMDQKSYHMTVYAPLTATQQLIRVGAQGGDTPGTDRMSYTIISGNEQNIFTIDENSGVIRAGRAYDQPGDFRLVVEVTDVDPLATLATPTEFLENGNGNGNGNAEPAFRNVSLSMMSSHFDRCGVLIQILRGNFRRPEFTFPNKINWTLLTPESNLKEIEEFSGGGHTKQIGQLLAFDGDDGEAGKLSYYFKEGDNLVTETEKFRVETETGKLFKIGPLDREHMNAYHLLVVAKDGGKPVSAMSQHVLTIQVQDIDDHEPKFLKRQYNFTIGENALENSLVGQVSAVDEDEAGNAHIFYFLASDQDNRYKNEDIRVDIKTGKIYAHSVFDRERIERYEFFVRASSSPIFNKTAQRITREAAEKDDSIAFVTVTVTDQNDNPVRFTQKQYFAGINSEAEPGREILRLSAEDVDSSSQNSIQYSILASNLVLDEFKTGGSVVPSPFRVDETSGRLTISSSAMRQYSGGNNRFLIKIGAKETIAPFYEDSAQVQVWVVENSQQVILTVKSKPEAMLKDQLVNILSNITNSLVLINKITPHVSEDLTVNQNWSDVYVTAVDKKTQGIIPVGQFLQALDLGHDRLRQSDSPVELYSAVPAMAAGAGSGSEGEYFFNNRDSFDTAFAGLVALVALLCMGLAAILAVCCCLNRLYSARSSESEKLHGGLKYPLHPGDSIPGTPQMGRHAGQQTADMMEDLATDNPLWIDHKLKTYEEQELTMQVASELDNSNGTEDGVSLNESGHGGHNGRGHSGQGHHQSRQQQSSPQFSHAYATLHPHPHSHSNNNNNNNSHPPPPPPPPAVLTSPNNLGLDYDHLNIMGQDTVAVHL